MRPIDPDLIFALVALIVSGVFFLAFTKMILSHFRDRRRNRGASLGTSELEALLQKAVEEGNESLHLRLDNLEHRVEQVQVRLDQDQMALPEPDPRSLLEEMRDPAETVEARAPRVR
ncbi:MAG: hypothetical protein ACE5G0_06365 [Rhodothermales bacterium]